MVSVSIDNLQKVKKQLQDYKKGLAEKNAELLERLHQEGVNIGHEKWATIEYDGDHRVEIPEEPEWIDNNKVGLSFKSDAVTFIEFGSGVQTYPDDHPLRSEPPFDTFERGEFGLGQGKNKHWVFHSEGRPITISTSTGQDIRGDTFLSQGNPANRVVYNTGKELREKVKDIAKEVYSK